MALLANRKFNYRGKGMEWREVKNDHPIDGEPVLMYEPHDMLEPPYGGFMFVGVKNLAGVWLNTMTLEEQFPSHWMPLPAPPTGA